MQNCTCYNTDGSYLTGMYQWDSNRDIIVKDLPIGTDPSRVFFRFSNTDGACAISVEPTRETNKYTVRVPDTLLEQPYNILMHIYLGSIDDVETTISRVLIHVESRQKASDELYTPTSGDVIADGLILINKKVFLRRAGETYGTGATPK